MQKSDIEKLRSLPSEGVAQRLGFKVERHKTLCPFHNDHTPSLTFKKNKFRCWSCGESGDTISLVMKVLNKDFLEACRWLAGAPLLSPQKGGRTEAPLSSSQGRGEPCFNPERYVRFFERPWLNEEARRFLFEERRLDARVVSWCRLTSWKDSQGVPWLQIPYYDRQGKLIGVQNRNLVKGASPRFRFPSGSQCTIYNLSVLNLLKPGEVLFIAEGCSDCWSLLSAGHKAIAIPSATLLSKKDVNLLQTLSSELSVRYEMYPDRDVPGERLFMQLKEVLPQLVHHQLPPDCKDFSDYYLSVIATRH